MNMTAPPPAKEVENDSKIEDEGVAWENQGKWYRSILKTTMSSSCKNAS
jgi:hypothetical protein